MKLTIVSFVAISARPCTLCNEQETVQRPGEATHDLVYELFEDNYGGSDLWTVHLPFFGK